jgi:hypothetical protein
MKIYFILLGLLISSGLARAAIQTTANQDKPPRLYVKSYTESNAGFTKCLTTWTGSSEEDDFSVNDSVSWTDGSAGSFSYTWHYTYQTPSFSYAQNDNVIISWPQVSWPNIEYLQPTWTETYINTLWTSEDYTNSTIAGYAPIILEHSDTSVPMVDNSGSYGPSGGYFTVIKATGTRTAQAIMKLQTGGKSTSRLRNLFGLTASATRYTPQHWSYWGYYEWLGEMPLDFGDLAGCYPAATSVPPQSINLGSYGALNTNGVKYLILPDNDDVDVTPYVAGADYYSFSFGQPQKYHSYFDLYVQQANPGFSLIFYNPTNDVGHAFWRFRTEAPQDALQYVSASLTAFLGTNWGFYPLNGLFTVPGILQNDNSHPYNISRSFYIGFPDLLQGLTYTRGISNSPPVYSLTGFNCVGAARGAGFAADVFGLPWDESPQNFGVTLIEMYPAPGQIIGPFIDTNDTFFSSAPY